MFSMSLSNLKLVFFLLFFLLLSSISMAKPQNKTSILVNVGVVVDDLNQSVSGNIWLSCIQMAVSDFYASHPLYNTRLNLKVRECEPSSALGAADAAVDLLKNEQVRAIFGPGTSMQTSFVINLGQQAHVPIISFSATSPSLTSLRSSYFFQFAENDSAQVEAISAIVKTFQWKQVVLIYEDTPFGEGVIPYLTDALQEIGARVPYRSVINPSATDDQIKGELYRLMTMQTRVFVVYMMPELCSRVFELANQIGMMREGYVWIITNGITNSWKSLNVSVLHSMHGVLGVETNIPTTKEYANFKKNWKQQFQQNHPNITGAELDIYGYWAYDSVYALAEAVEQVIGSTSGTYRTSFSHKQNAHDEQLTCLEGFPHSPYGPKLRKALSYMKFSGLSGDVNIHSGQRQSSDFQIVNVNGGGKRTVGYWGPKRGLWHTIKNSSGPDLAPVIWPGHCFHVPKGWEFPTNGKRLRIGVPMKDGFTEFVKITRDEIANTTAVTGFSIDVFKAAVINLRYALLYDFIPFTKPDGTSNGTYDDMCYQVSRGDFDAAVGDITIEVNQLKYVDFTMPYTEAGVVMVVPVIDMGSKSAWAFLEPWTLDLWLTTFCFSLFIGFIVWVLEHRFNDDFRGPVAHQVGTGVWFSFSTVASAQTEKVVSNLARFVMTIWMFVVLVLTINYTANLTSLYTIEKLQPTVNDIHDLLRNGDTVGYTRNAYVYGLLRKVGFEDSNLKEFGTMEEIDEALAKGGIAAVVDETPYMKLFIAKYCNKYAMVGPIFKTGGFAFALAKQSPLLPDISEAILQVTQGQKIMDIEKKWFQKPKTCQLLGTPKVSSTRLGSNSFWVLFLISGLASVFALIIYLASFIHRHMHIFMQQPEADTETSTWGKIRTLFEIFNEKDPNYPAASKWRQPQDAVPPYHNGPQSPWSHIDTSSVFSGNNIHTPPIKPPHKYLRPADAPHTYVQLDRE